MKVTSDSLILPLKLITLKCTLRKLAFDMVYLNASSAGENLLKIAVECKGIFQTLENWNKIHTISSKRQHFFSHTLLLRKPVVVLLTIVLFGSIGALYLVKCVISFKKVNVRSH